MTADDYRFVIRQTGGPDVMLRETVDPDAAPGVGEVRIRHHAIGLNFIDLYYRSGLNPVRGFPSGLGLEAVGLIEAVGEGVDQVRVGDRVGYGTGVLGAYATVRIMPADLLIPIPDELDAMTAAAAITKGMTAEVLVTRCAKVKPGQIVLVHAAAGGVGSFLVQWLKTVGATVIAHAGSEDKAKRAAELGADHALSGKYSTLAEKIRQLTGGHGADVVFDGVGAASWRASLASVAKTGMLVSFGNASGDPSAVTMRALAQAGSIMVTRPNSYHYLDTRARRCAAVATTFDKMIRGELKIHIGAVYPLAEVARAHHAIEARETIGSTVLQP